MFVGWNYFFCMLLLLLFWKGVESPHYSPDTENNLTHNSKCTLPVSALLSSVQGLKKTTVINYKITNVVLLVTHHNCQARVPKQVFSKNLLLSHRALSKIKFTLDETAQHNIKIYNLWFMLFFVFSKCFKKAASKRSIKWSHLLQKCI